MFWWQSSIPSACFCSARKFTSNCSKALLKCDTSCSRSPPPRQHLQGRLRNSEKSCMYTHSAISDSEIKVCTGVSYYKCLIPKSLRARHWIRKHAYIYIYVRTYMSLANEEHSFLIYGAGRRNHNIACTMNPCHDQDKPSKAITKQSPSSSRGPSVGSSCERILLVQMCISWLSCDFKTLKFMTSLN